MRIVAQDTPGMGMTRDRALGALNADVFQDLASVEAVWRGLESDGALATPYQRFDWVSAFVSAAESPELRIIVLRDTLGRARMVLPLRVARERGVQVARVIGDKHANFQMPLFASREAATMDPEELKATLIAAGHKLGIDIYALGHQPRFWDGASNPLSANGHPCASNAYGLILGPEPDATLKRVYSGEARKKLRTKERKLVEAHGPIEYRTATTPETLEEILTAFYAQKSARMAAMGLPDPYACEAVRAFLSRGADRRSDAETYPSIEVHALVATRSNRILATFGGAVDQNRFSGMWTSFDLDPELGRFSPGDLLLHHLVAEQTRLGRRALDLGVGEARYKSSICDETIELVQTLIPVTLIGQAFALGSIGAARLKRHVKRSQRLWSLVSRLRRRRTA